MIGMSVSDRYRSRCMVFDELIIMTERIKNDITYLMLPLGDIFLNIESDGLCKSLSFLKVFKFRYLSGIDFPGAWSFSVENSALPLGETEKQRLLQLGLSLGRSDADIQKSIISVYITYIVGCAETAKRKKEKYSVTAVLCGVLLGGALFILFI